MSKVNDQLLDDIATVQLTKETKTNKALLESASRLARYVSNCHLLQVIHEDLEELKTSIKKSK